MDINEIIEQLRALDVPNSGIKAALKKRGFSQEEIEEALPTTKRVTFASEFYDWLAEEKREYEDAKAFILADKNSENVKKHLSHYLNIAELAAKIWDQK